MILIEILIHVPSSYEYNRDKIMSNNNNKLYTSNLYDSKQKSRSHLVLFETIDVNKNDRKHGNKSARQLEHSNAFGYLGKPFIVASSSSNTAASPATTTTKSKFKQRNQPRKNIQYRCQSIHNLFDCNDGNHRHQTPRASTPIIQTLANRNESNGVRSALMLIDQNDSIPISQDFLIDNSIGDHYYDHEDDDDDGYVTNINKEADNDSEINELSYRYDYNGCKIIKMSNNSNDKKIYDQKDESTTMIDVNNNTIINDYKIMKDLSLQLPLPSSLILSSTNQPKKMVKQNELSPDNGSYFLQIPMHSIHKQKQQMSKPLIYQDNDDDGKNLNINRQNRQQFHQPSMNNDNDANIIVVDVFKKKHKQKQRLQAAKQGQQIRNINNNNELFYSSSINDLTSSSKIYSNIDPSLNKTLPLTTPTKLAAKQKKFYKYPYDQQLQSFSLTMSDMDLRQQQQQPEDDEPESSQNRVLIKNGKLVNDDAIFKADIYIDDGIIKDIGPHLIVPGGVKTIDANGFYVVPGGIDTHTHMDATFMGARSADDFYSGTRAGLAGGTTTIMDIVMTGKGESLIDAFKRYRLISDGIACCDYAFHVAIPEFVKGKTDVEMETLAKDYGINSFKVFMAYKDVLMLRDEDLINVLIKCRQLGALPLVHAENGDIIDYNVRKLKSLGITGPEGHLQSRPEEVEAEAVHRITTIANQVNCPVYIVHVNSKSAADAVADARKRGCLVYGEPIAAGIGSDGTHYFNKCWHHAAGHVMSPPLRPDRTTSDHLINMLASGQLQTTGSDHCVFKSTEKARGTNDFSLIPNGVNGVEERMMILWEKAVRTGKLDPRQFVAVTSTNAAKIFNLYPRKGRLAKGSDADLVIWGPKPHIIRAENHNSNSDFNIFEGTQISFGPLVVISNGRVVLDENGLHVVQGVGRYLPCSPNSSYVWHSVRERERLLPIRIDRDDKDEQKQQQQASALSEQPSAALNLQNGTTPPTATMSLTPPIFPQIIDPICTRENQATPNFYKGTTRSGVRNLQDSSFNLSGAQIDDDKIGKTAIRVQNPPGGRSSGIW